MPKNPPPNRKRHTIKFVVQKLSAQMPGLTAAEIARMADFVLLDILENTVETGRTEIRSFGVFSVHLQKPRSVKLPNQEEPIQLPYRKVIKFKASAKWEEKLSAWTKGEEDPLP